MDCSLCSSPSTKSFEMISQQQSQQALFVAANNNPITATVTATNDIASSPMMVTPANSTSTSLLMKSESEDAPKRRKARRAPRKDKRSEKRATFKPYSFLTWQERKELELKEAQEAQGMMMMIAPSTTPMDVASFPLSSVSAAPSAPSALSVFEPAAVVPCLENYGNNTNTTTTTDTINTNNFDSNANVNGNNSLSNSNNKNKKRRRNRHCREQPPPAPRNLTQMIVAERSSPDEPNELDDSFFIPSERQESISSCDTSGEGFFEKAYEESLYDELTDLNRDALIARIRERDRELELLHEELRALREAHLAPLAC